MLLSQIEGNIWQAYNFSSLDNSGIKRCWNVRHWPGQLWVSAGITEPWDLGHGQYHGLQCCSSVQLRVVAYRAYAQVL